MRESGAVRWVAPNWIHTLPDLCRKRWKRMGKVLTHWIHNCVSTSFVREGPPGGLFLFVEHNWIYIALLMKELTAEDIDTICRPHHTRNVLWEKEISTSEGLMNVISGTTVSCLGWGLEINITSLKWSSTVLEVINMSPWMDVLPRLNKVGQRSLESIASPK